MLQRPNPLPLRLIAYAYLYKELAAGVHEEKPNWGKRIAEYFASLEPPIRVPAPWCAALQQFVTDKASKSIGVQNPLDGVILEALVQSYADFVKKNGMIVPATQALAGDLVLYHFGNHYDHIGMLAGPVSKLGYFRAIEGNTNDNGSREGTKIAGKTRQATPLTLFARWDRGITGVPPQEVYDVLGPAGLIAA